MVLETIKWLALDGCLQWAIIENVLGIKRKKMEEGTKSFLQVVMEWLKKEVARAALGWSELAWQTFSSFSLAGSATAAAATTVADASVWPVLALLRFGCSGVKQAAGYNRGLLLLLGFLGGSRRGMRHPSTSTPRVPVGCEGHSRTAGWDVATPAFIHEASEATGLPETSPTKIRPPPPR